jgi:hypothetical protein
MKWYEICHNGTYQYVLVYTSMYLFHCCMYKYMNISFVCNVTYYFNICLYMCK